MKDGEHADGTEPTADQNVARRLAVEAAAAWIDSFEGFEGSIITGYVLIVETQKVGDIPQVTWMTGNGVAPPDDEDRTEGLSTHRVRGLLQQAEVILLARAIAEQLRRLDD